MDKVFVDVEYKTLRSGALRPQIIHWIDGRVWTVKRTLHSCTSSNGEFEGIRYTILIGSAEKYLYRTGTQWYVESIP